MSSTWEGGGGGGGEQRFYYKGADPAFKSDLCSYITSFRQITVSISRGFTKSHKFNR